MRGVAQIRFESMRPCPLGPRPWSPSDPLTVPPSRSSESTANSLLVSCGQRMSSFIFNVTFDAADPRRLAAFWSEVTGYTTVAERDDFVALQAPDKRGVRRILFFQVPRAQGGEEPYACRPGFTGPGG